MKKGKRSLYVFILSYPLLNTMLVCDEFDVCIILRVENGLNATAQVAVLPVFHQAAEKFIHSRP